MVMSRTMALRSQCNRCDCHVELGFVPWRGTGPATAADWACPECSAINQVPAIGEVVWVETSRRPDKPARPTPSTH